MPKIKDKKNYVNNKEFQKEMIKSVEAGELTPTAVNMILKIANRVANTKFYYVFEDDRYTCMSQGIEDCLRYWKNYDPVKYDNPFSYFTMIIMNGIMRQFNELYKVSASNRISINTVTNLYNI